MTTKYVSEGIDSCLEKYGESLKPSDEFIDTGKHLAQKVFLKLQQCLADREFSVAEPRFGGSLGKSTGVITSDLDLVVVVNNRVPPFDDEGDVLDTMEEILLKYHGELLIQPGTIMGKMKKVPAGKPRVTIQFSFRNGMEVDLLPAANLERNEVLAEIAKNPEKNYYMYNSSLIATQLAFMKSQDSFTHSLIRLGKVWFKGLDFGDKNFFGGSTIMELICCAAAEAEEAEAQKKSLERSMFGALERVLQMVSRIDSLKLAFIKTSSENWQAVYPSNTETSLVPNVVGTTDILKRKCFIVEPANPYCDVLDNNTLLPMLKNFAGQFLNKLRMTKLLAFNFRVTEQFYIEKLFETQLKDLTKQYRHGATQHFLCGYAYSCSSRFPDMKVRNEDVYKRREVQDFVEAMKWNLVVAVTTAINERSEDTGSSKTNFVATAVRNVIKTCLNTELATAKNENHEDYHITLTIPYQVGNDGYAVKCSLRW